MPFGPSLRPGRRPTLIGQTLAHYRVTAAIGAGGMGEVYRATDTKLGREVAVKVLPSELAADPERLARFEREAKLLASLNHPNIAHVYGFEKATPSGGTAVHFLAMELVDGDDLAERLKRGPIPVDEAIAVATQIAQALEAAHDKGIVHRDLKPANVKVTPEGKVKVLDFGLAKAWTGEDPGGTSSGDLSRSPTLAHTGTAAGLILGTAAYMSPEQARGRAVDKRADVWAFGVVLWEMLTGRLKRVDLAGGPARELAEAPDHLLAQAFDSRTLTVWSPDGQWIVYTMAGVQADVVRSRADGSGQPEVLLPRKRSDGDQLATAISPDGKLLVLTEDSAETGSDLWTLSLVDRSRKLVLGTRFNEQAAVFSPDGRTLAFVSDETGRGEVYVQPFPGPGARRQVSVGGGWAPVWGRTAGELFYQSGTSLMSVSLGVTGIEPETPREVLRGVLTFDPTTLGDMVAPWSLGPGGRGFVMPQQLDQKQASTLMVDLNWAPGPSR